MSARGRVKFKIGDAVVVAARIVHAENGFFGLSLLDNNDRPRVTDLLFSEAGIFKKPRWIRIRHLSKNEVQAAQRAFMEE
jgi:hypothetical protein